MAIKYSLVEKRTSPSNPDSEKKWYASPQSAASLTGKAMTRAATKNTTTAPIEMEAALELLGEFVPDQLLQGHTVTIPGLGYFRLSFKSKGADTVQDFNAQEMIYDVRPVFVPSAEFRKRVKDGAKFEDGGVRQNGVSYRTRADYYQATGQEGSAPGGGSGSSEGGGGEDPMG